MRNYKELIGEYRDIEFEAQVGLDDIINKVTQECGEVVEASENNDIEEMHKESGDALINVLSTADSFGVTPEVMEKKYVEPVKASKLLIDLADWNSKVQAYRNRYSKEAETLENVALSTQTLVDDILSFSHKSFSVLDMMEHNIVKFSGRVERYFPDLDIREYIKDVKDFPKVGVGFKDISPLLRDEEAMRYVTFKLAQECRGADVIAGLDARGFFFAQRVAQLLGKPFVMIRKSGKLPGKVYEKSYGLEYGTDTIELQKESVNSGQKVALIDDLLASGGTLNAAAQLIEQAGAEVNNIATVIALNDEDLDRKQERKELNGYNVSNIISYN